MYFFSGMRQHCTLGKTKSSEKHHYSLCAMGNLMCWLLLILQDVVLTFKTSVLLSTSRWPIPSKLMCIALVGLSVYVCVERYLRGFLSGRTGRAGKMGIAITFLTNDDDEVMYVI
jgi:hypothetical protein